jgi:hypothetical protein
MMHYHLKPTLTPARRAWLEQLKRDGPSHRSTTRVGFDCMQLGWTTWHYVDKQTRQPITAEEARERWGIPDWWEHVDMRGEALTEAGRKMLG